MIWKPSRGKGECVLPGDLRRVDVRPPSLREVLTVNPRARVLHCESPSGAVLVAVMPEELGHLVEAIKSAES